MIDSIINRSSIPLLEKLLNLSAQRQKAIASNVAHSTTPGYTRQDVAFDELLEDAVDQRRLAVLREDPRHIPSGKREQIPVLQTLQELKGEGGASEVNIEQEMAESAKNQQLYSTAARLISGSFKALQASVRGRF